MWYITIKMDKPANPIDVGFVCLFMHLSWKTLPYVSGVG